MRKLLEITAVYNDRPAGSDAELLAELLQAIYSGAKAAAVADALIDRYKRLDLVLNATVAGLSAVEGMTDRGACFLAALPGVFNRYERAAASAPGDTLTKSEEAKDFCKSLFVGDNGKESFYLIALSNRKKVIETVKLASGTVDEAPVYTRNILRAVLDLGAHSVILAHNHPGGSLTPSAADISLTNNIVKALEPVSVVVNDHVVVAAGGRALSFKEEGYI